MVKNKEFCAFINLKNKFMKKNILFSLLLLLSAVTFCQQTTVPPLTKAEYLQKSKGQKTAAWILLGVGVTCAAIAAPGNVSLNSLLVLIIGGGAAAIGSIPLFIASAKNKRKAIAATTFFKMETVPVIQQNSFVKHSFPVVSIKIHL